MLSTKIKLASGKIIARGIPGKPPPVPKSNIVASFLNFINFAMDRE